MKALEILNNDNIFDERYLSENNRYLKDDIREAIKELEEMQNRTCENCKYFTSSPNTNKYDCCEKGISDTSISFCCNKWESIDEK